jgi:hypothetical protein
MRGRDNALADFIMHEWVRTRDIQSSLIYNLFSFIRKIRYHGKLPRTLTLVKPLSARVNHRLAGRFILWYRLHLIMLNKFKFGVIKMREMNFLESSMIKLLLGTEYR